MVARVWRKKARESVMIALLSCHLDLLLHHCHPDRSEGSAVGRKMQIPRFARDDKTFNGWHSFSLQLSPPQRSAAAHAGFELFPQRAGVQQVEKTFHLARECTPIAEPPDFFHARQQVGVDVFHAYHFLQSPAPMRAAQAALHASMRSFADAETRHGAVHHHCASMYLASQSLAAGAIASPNAGG